MNSQFLWCIVSHVLDGSLSFLKVGKRRYSQSYHLKMNYFWHTFLLLAYQINTVPLGREILCGLSEVTMSTNGERIEYAPLLHLVDL